MSRLLRSRMWPVALLALVLGVAPAAAQTTYTWTGASAADSDWFTPENWSASGAATPPPASDLANTFLVLTGSTRNANVLDYSFSANGLVYDAAAGPFVTSALPTTETLTLGVGGVTIASGNANNQAFNANLALGANQSWVNNSTGLFSVGGAVSSGNFGLTVGGTGSTTVSGRLTGTGPLTLNSASTLTLTNTLNTSSFTGAVNVSNGGVLAFNTQAALGASAGVITLDGGTLRNTATMSGGSFVSGSRMSIVLNPAGGTFDIGGAGIVSVVNAATVISGSGGLTKAGTGTLSVASLNTYAGPTRVAQGVLQLRTSSERFPASTAMTVDAGATLDLIGFNQTLGSLAGAGTVNVNSGLLTVGDGNSTSFAGVVQGATGRLTKVGTGTLTLTGANTYAGGTTVNGGTLAGSGSVSSTVTVNSGGAVRGGATGTTGVLTVAGNAIVNQNGVLRFEASRTGTGAADASRLDLTGAARILNLNPGTGNTFTIDLLNGASGLVAGESYTLTLAAVAAGGTIRLNGGTLTPNAVIGSANYVLRSDSFAGFTDTTLFVDGAATSLRVTFTPVPVPEPAAVLGLAAGVLALGGVARRRLLG